MHNLYVYIYLYVALTELEPCSCTRALYEHLCEHLYEDTIKKNIVAGGWQQRRHHGSGESLGLLLRGILKVFGNGARKGVRKGVGKGVRKGVRR